MKKKLALLMAAIMTVAMVPVTALASTKSISVDEVSTATDEVFVSIAELVKDDKQTNVDEDDYPDYFEVILKLTNGKFAKNDDDDYYMELNTYTGVGDNDAANPVRAYAAWLKAEGYISAATQTNLNNTIKGIDVKNDTTAYIKLNTRVFNQNFRDPDDNAIKNFKACVLPIAAVADAEGEVVGAFSSNVTQFKKASVTIATAYGTDVDITSEGTKVYVEDETKDIKKIKAINIDGLVNNAIRDGNNNVEITLKLKGNFKFYHKDANTLYQKNDSNNYSNNTEITDADDIVSFLNDTGASAAFVANSIDDDTIKIELSGLDKDILTKMIISGIFVQPTSKCDAGDIGKLTISSKQFDSVTLEVAKMVEEAVTYTVEDDELPVIWAGKDYKRTSSDESNTLKVSVEENTGDILNTSRKATFTFPEGIEVVGIDFKEKELPEDDFKAKIDENVVTIWNYSKDKIAKRESEKATDFGMKFLLNAAPTFSGDVEVTLGGEFDDVTLKVATVKAPYTVEAKTTEVLIDYRYVPVNEIVITEADDGLLEDGDVITLAVEKMRFEDAGAYEVTSGDIEVDVNVQDDDNWLNIEVKDESTEPSTIVISGLELYLDRTLPVGGYALQNRGDWGSAYKSARAAKTLHKSNNILWENSSTDKDDYDPEAIEDVTATPVKALAYDAIFKYKEVTCNDSYVEVVTQARDQDDYTTNRKIVLTIGAATMAVGTETITLDTPAYINSENYTQLPLRAVSEAFGATVNWDDASRTVTIMMGQRVVSMTIGSKTMYVNGTPVAMNTAPEITNSRTFVPVRDLANALGITKIDWNEASATVTLN